MGRTKGIQKLKYFQGTTNGINSCIVAANSKAAAIRAAGISRYYFEQYWGEVAKPEGFNFKPFTLYIGGGSLLLDEPFTWEPKGE